MDAEYANYYTREVMLILIREFQSPDEEMKKIVLKVVKQCCATDGVEPGYIKDDVLPPFFKHFWNQRMALDRRNYRQVCNFPTSKDNFQISIHGLVNVRFSGHGFINVIALKVLLSGQISQRKTESLLRIVIKMYRMQNKSLSYILHLVH